MGWRDGEKNIQLQLNNNKFFLKTLSYIYTMECYTAEGNKELLPFTTAWMKLESIMLSEISQAANTNTI